jgi:hypothetical protein
MTDAIDLDHLGSQLERVLAEQDRIRVSAATVASAGASARSGAAAKPRPAPGAREHPPKRGEPGRDRGALDGAGVALGPRALKERRGCCISTAAARESLGNLWAAALVWPERCPGGACGCRPGQGGEDRVTLLAFRSRPREAGHIALI